MKVTKFNKQNTSKRSRSSNRFSKFLISSLLITSFLPFLSTGISVGFVVASNSGQSNYFLPTSEKSDQIDLTTTDDKYANVRKRLAELMVMLKNFGAQVELFTKLASKILDNRERLAYLEKVQEWKNKLQELQAQVDELVAKLPN